MPGLCKCCLTLAFVTHHWNGFLSYLSERQQCVRVEHSVSQYVGCSRGVPQGSVLGPLLFVLYTSDMSSVLPGSVCHQEFADDVALDYSDYQPDLVCSVLSNAVTRLAEYLDNIGLLLNASKTQVMFVRPRGCLEGPSEVKCGTTVLDVTPVTKYLGVMLDDQLSWKPQVDFIASKTATTIGQLWRHGRCLSPQCPPGLVHEYDPVCSLLCLKLFLSCSIQTAATSTATHC